ncbi:MAG: T9SS type A sorting domain-containing protein [Saprospiraceae bacterium]|nr:T9SS type A sorting domain-containing protein [Saprospiraceae bacterium]
MRFLLLTACLIFSSHSYSQDFISIPFEVVTKVCPSDSSVTFLGIANWDIYQTEDNSNDGDKTILCENMVVREFGRSYLPLENIDIEKTIFISNSSPLNLDIASNRLYEIHSTITWNFPGAFLAEPDNNGRTNELLVKIVGEGQTGNQLLQESLFQNKANNPESQLRYYDCLLTEKQENQTIEELVYSISIKEKRNNSEIRLTGANLLAYPWGDNTFANTVIGNEYFNNGTYVPDPQLFAIVWHENTKILHQSDGDPGPNNVHYYNIQVEDSTAQQIIDLNLDDRFNVIFQSFTQMRGALVAGQDSLRHRFNLNLDGASMCIPFAFELVTEEDNEFRYKSGQVNFNALNACMQFKEGSKLRIMENARFHFGQNGVGLLSLKPGSEVVIEEGAELYIDGQVLLSGHRDSKSIKIELGPGQRLSFSPNANIYPLIDDYHFKQIDVYLNGGELDIQHLDQESLNRLNIIYTTSTSDAATLHIFPNPVSDFIAIQNKNYPHSIEISIINLNGQAVISTKGNSQYLNLDVRNLEQGNYFITGGDMKAQKLIVAH